MRALLLSICLLFYLCGYTQDSALAKLQQVPDKYYSQVQAKSRKYEQQITKRTDKALSRLLRQEQKMKQRLSKVDSVAANNIFTRSVDSLGNLKARLRQKTGKYEQALQGNYGGYLDTLQQSLGFLKESKSLLDKTKGAKDKLSGSLQSVQQLQSKLQQAEQIKAYIRERRQQLKAQLAGYTGFTKDLQKINKEAYYYAQQLNEYKSVFKDRKKAEAKAMEILHKVPAFNDFMQRNSRLAGLFNLQNAGTAASQSLEGLQTRAQVEQLIQQRIGSGGPDARAALSQQMEAARSQMDQLKKQFPDLDNAAEMPDFKPNEMKTKSLLQRLEFGGNLQFQRSNRFFPTTTDIAAQVGYKFHKNGSAGLGAAYKLGMGTGFDNIRFNSQGVGLRSFVDWKLKGTFFVNGGFEQNYNTPFGDVSQLKNYQNWTGSALLGISKKYKINAKMKGTMVLLYDFLYNQHIPRTDPIKFRLGYNF